MKTYHDIPTDGGSNIIEQVTEQANRVQARLASVRHVVAVMSGKGGVGKSSITVNLAAALARDGQAVGILDADINGPSIAKMTGVRDHTPQADAAGMTPATGALGIKVMSIDLFLPQDGTPVLWNAPTQQDAYTWRGMMEMAALREFLADTAWGTLDLLLVDLPPGADKLPNLADVLPSLSGTIVVTIPSGVSQLVVAKSITMAKEIVGRLVIGLVENMAAYVCAHCGQEEALFPVGRVEELAAGHDVPYLGRIPFDPRLAAAADDGTLFMQHHHATPAGQSIAQIAEKVRAFLG